MRYAINIPNFGAFADPRAVAELAYDAEQVGWDGFFIWDHFLWTHPQPQPVAEPWVLLSAIAMRTERIRFGALVTPLPRRRPWQVARQAVTLDHLSGGRLILGVGIGGDWFGDYSGFGEPADDRTHGEQLDEALDIITGLWRAEPFSYSGKHYTLREARMLPAPFQQPRIPIWVAGMWPGAKPFRRAARYDGVTPIPREMDAMLQPEDIRAIREYIRPYRSGADPFDLVIGGPPLTQEQYAAYAEAGVTWYQDGFMPGAELEMVRQHIRKGPPGTAGISVDEADA